MAVQSVDELHIKNFVDTGLTTPLDRYTFDLEIKWTNFDGTTGSHASNRTFPNALSAMPLDARRRNAERMITEIVRVELGLGINTWEDFK